MQRHCARTRTAEYVAVARAVNGNPRADRKPSLPALEHDACNAAILQDRCGAHAVQQQMPAAFPSSWLASFSRSRSMVGGHVTMP